MTALSSLVDPFTADPDPAVWTVTGSTTYVPGTGLVQTDGSTMRSVDRYDFDSATLRLDLTAGLFFDWYSFTVGQDEEEGNPYPDNRVMFINITGGTGIAAWFQGYDDAAWDPATPPSDYWPGYGGVMEGTYDPVAMRYLKMTNTVDAGVLTATFETSPDGQAWATFFQFTATPDATFPFRVALGGTTNIDAVLADFNVAIGGSDMANAVYNAFKQGLLNAEYDLNTASIKVALVRTYTFDATHATVADVIAAGGVLNGTSAALGSPSITGGLFDADDTTIATTADANQHGLLVFQASAVTGGADVAQNAQKLIAYFDTGTGLPIVPGTGTVTVTWANTTNRILKVG